jgi:hypothetical protein
VKVIRFTNPDDKVKLPFNRVHPYRVLYRRVWHNEKVEDCVFRASNLILALKSAYWEFHQMGYKGVLISEDPESEYKRGILIPEDKIEILLYAYNSGVVQNDFDIIMYYQDNKNVIRGNFK